MGFKVGKDVPPMERELIYLLSDLYVKWGFCIPPDSFDRISKMEYYYVDDFTLDVLEAEGVETAYETVWKKKISEKFKERFGDVKIDAITFQGRIRGQKEDW